MLQGIAGGVMGRYRSVSGGFKGCHGVAAISEAFEGVSEMLGH